MEQVNAKRATVLAIATCLIGMGIGSMVTSGLDEKRSIQSSVY